MADDLADKYPSAARFELRSTLWYPTTVAAVGALGLAWAGAAELEGWRAWAAFAGAGALCVVIWGFWTFRAWSRWVVVAVAAAALLLQLVVLLTGGAEGARLPRALLGIAFWGVVGASFAHPATGRRFALARSRWVPRSERGPGGRAASGEAPPRP